MFEETLQTVFTFNTQKLEGLTNGKFPCNICAKNNQVLTVSLTLWTHHERIRGTHTVEAVVEGSKLLINGFIQQEVDVELDVLCGDRRNTMV